MEVLTKEWLLAPDKESSLPWKDGLQKPVSYTIMSITVKRKSTVISTARLDENEYDASLFESHRI